MPESGERSLVSRAFVNGSERRLRTGWRLLALTVVLVVTVVAVGFVLGVLQAAFVVGEFGSFPVVFTSQFLTNVAWTVSLVVLAWLVDRRTLPDLGLGGDGWWSNLAFGLLLGVVMTSAVFALELAAGLVTVQGTVVTRQALGIAASQPFALSLGLTVLLFVAVGVGEEVLVRGYLMTNVAEGLNGLGPMGPRAAVGVAAVLTSALFGVLHLGNPGATAISAFNIAVVGLFFAGAYVATDDLGVPIGVHVTWNFSLSSVYGFPVSGLPTPATVLDVRQTGDPLVTGGSFGPEAGLVFYLALAVAVSLTWWWVRRRQGAVRFRTGVAVPDLRKPVSEYLE